jgi:hypothetical protein
MRESIDIEALAARLEVPAAAVEAMAEASAFRMAESGGRRFIRIKDAARIVRELDTGARLRGDYRRS